MLQGDHKKAREYLGKTVEIQPSYPQAKSLAGWIELTCGSDVKAKKAIDMFKEAQAANPADVDAVLGQAAYLEQVKKDMGGAIDVLAGCIVKLSWFTPAEAEKARLLLARGDWELASESANRALQLDPNSIPALSLSILVLLAKESKFSAASSRLGELVDLIKEAEPHNPQLCRDESALFSRLCARHGPILNQCLQLITKATQLDPSNSAYRTELGYQLTLAGDFGAALTSYTEACKLDEANMTACYGKITCQILRGDSNDIEEAAQQFEFLNEIHGGSGAPSDLCYIGALVASRKERDAGASVRQLQETARVHLESAALDIISTDALIKLNPDFVTNLAKEMLEYAGSEPPPSGEPASPLVAKALDMLRPVMRACPGILAVKLMVAHTRYLSADFDGAQTALSDAISMDPTHAASHMLMAKIFIELQRYREANTSLEQALSHSFSVRESPLYFLLRAQCHEKQGDWKQALAELQAAMKLPGVAATSAPAPSGRGAAKQPKPKGPSQEERAQIFIHLATGKNSENSARHLNYPSACTILLIVENFCSAHGVGADTRGSQNHSGCQGRVLRHACTRTGKRHDSCMP
jgi:tetratricopeptide (TPR) repeat protein